MMRSKFKQYYALVKFNLSFLVVFSAVMSYVLVENLQLEWNLIGWLSLGGFLITASANSLNQIIERDSDALMERTAKRPLASKEMSLIEAQFFAFATAFSGSFILYYFFNSSTALVALLSLASYAWVYTPFKKINSLAVFIGAIPGALPCMIGWLAGEPQLLLGGWILFLFQFFWQFPHFWAIAWLAHEDYTKAGFKLLPSKDGKSQYAALQSLIYTLLLFPIGFLPYLIGMCTLPAALVILLANVALCYQSFQLYRNRNAASARRVMFTTYINLPIVYFALYWGKLQ